MPKNEIKAEAAPVVETAPLPEGHVLVRVLAKGSGKIHTGAELIVGQPPETYKQRDMVVFPRDIAEGLQKRDYVEIEGETKED